ncbi:hypothetical protein [Methylobacterium haplocladii]|nr:hypothetical protein [Methylobacterium haplocladii]GJD83699.1 hypothetical protein HPGCJGGD_1569 [Methylobacterium haplocladii]
MHARPETSDTTSRLAPKHLIMLGISLCLVALAAGGCGRRGKLESPSGATSERSSGTSAPASARSLPNSVGVASAGAAPDSDAVRDGDELPLSATPAGVDSGAPVQTNKGARKGFTVPKGPFILDPIL